MRVGDARARARATACWRTTRVCGGERDPSDAREDETKEREVTSLLGGLSRRLSALRAVLHHRRCVLSFIRPHILPLPHCSLCSTHSVLTPFCLSPVAARTTSIYSRFRAVTHAARKGSREFINHHVSHHANYRTLDQPKRCSGISEKSSSAGGRRNISQCHQTSQWGIVL